MQLQLKIAKQYMLGLSGSSKLLYYCGLWFMGLSITIIIIIVIIIFAKRVFPV